MAQPLRHAVGEVCDDPDCGPCGQLERDAAREVDAVRRSPEVRRLTELAEKRRRRPQA